MFPLAAIARSFNRNSSTIASPVTLHNTTKTTIITNIVSTVDYSVFISKYCNNDNDIEHVDSEIPYSNSSRKTFFNYKNKNNYNNFNNYNYDDKYMEPYLI